ncbi:MAG: hypothetical protein M1820_000932 [Bogoriella megaspora]|nr:MAG: hypothetical protein M1820_000932 [Bogoriella megaspora]
MQVKFALLASLIGTTFAAPAQSSIEKRDFITIDNALNSVNSATQTLDTAVKAFDGSIDSLLAVNTDSGNVLTAIQNANTAVAGTSPVLLAGALAVAGTTTKLVQTVDTTIDDLIDKKPAFDTAGVTSLVLSQLQQQSDASNTLGQTIKGKVPLLAKPIADVLNAQISSAFQRGIKAFSS